MSAQKAEVIIVGIDIGMTCTGVAIGLYHRSGIYDHGPSIIQNWPGATGVINNKVPTKVAYRAGKARLHSWGFECPGIENIGNGMAVKDMFKFYLDRNYQRDCDLEDVRLWYNDFLNALYYHIAGHLQKEYDLDLNSTAVEFIFSLPTSWNNNPQLAQIFREVVSNTKFGADNVIMKLTEGEAAAVFTAKYHKRTFKQGDTFIVCDAGGGTTDMSILEVVKVSGNTVELGIIGSPEVLAVGSVTIDELFESKAEERLRRLSLPHPERMAHRITRGQFQQIKMSFGTGLILPVFNLEVPDLSQRIELSSDELKDMFDDQVRQIFEFIDNGIKILHWHKPTMKKPYLVLAGGLGSSKYVQAEITQRYEGENIEVLFAGVDKDLPLAVCKGLVINRLQYFSDKVSVIPTRSSVASYGILCSELFSKKHEGQRGIKNRLDGNKYAENQIDWLVIGGDRHGEDELIKRTYSRIIRPTDRNNSWGFVVVRSLLKPPALPDFLNQGGSLKILCRVVSDLGPGLDNTCVTRRRGLALRPVEFLRVDYELSAIVEPGKLRFQARIIGQEESETQTLEVHWLDDGEERVGEFLDCLIRNSNL